MRRVLMVLTVAALLAAMMVSAGPAQAQANEASFENSTNCVQGDVEFICGSGDDDGDFFGFGDDVGSFGFGPFGFGNGVTFFNSDDDDESFGGGDISDRAFVLCNPCNFDRFAPGGTEVTSG
jgi:hypothetical protein